MDMPDNAMAYPAKSYFTKMQWDLLCDPGFVLGVFEKDEDAEEVVVNNIKELADKYKNPDGTLTFLSLAGKPISIKVDKLSQISFANEEDLFGISAVDFPIGALSSFIYDGIRYAAIKNASTMDFTGYMNKVQQSPVTLYKDLFSINRNYNNVLVGVLCIKAGVPVFKVFPTNYLEVNSSNKNVSPENYGQGTLQAQFFLNGYLNNESNAVEVYGQTRNFSQPEAFFINQYGAGKDICGSDALYFLANTYYINKTPTLLNCLKDLENDLNAKLSSNIRKSELSAQLYAQQIDNTAVSSSYRYAEEVKFYQERYKEKYIALANSTDALRELNNLLKEYSKALNSGAYANMSDMTIKQIMQLLDLSEAKGRICLIRNMPLELRKKILDKSGQ
jgi:hypothetical protein